MFYQWKGKKIRCYEHSGFHKNTVFLVLDAADVSDLVLGSGDHYVRIFFVRRCLWKMKNFLFAVI